MKTNLQKVRKKAGYKSARAFAEAYGMNTSTYTDYEQGRHAFTLEQAWDFADFLGCTLDELAGREFPRNYDDPRQAAINADYQVLDEATKDMAAASIHGMAIATLGGEATEKEAPSISA